MRCGLLGGGCEQITGATGSSYTAGVEDLGHNLFVLVTATSSLGAASAASAESQPVLGILPKNTLPPSISGVLQDGQLLSASPGAWSGSEPISYAYQWQLCNALGKACENIEGATGSTLKLDPSEIGKTLALLVTATNAAGSVSQASAVTGLIAGILPKNTTLPSISGVLQDGQLLSASPGAWSGSEPISYAYQWQLCNALGKACENIEGATGSTLKLDPSEIGKTLALLVTATNAAGSVSQASAVTGLIEGILPKNTLLPSISGVLQDGQLLSASSGAWSGSEPISYAYQWQLCNALGKACENIEGATGSTLKLDPSEIGKTLALLVTATNAAGSVSQASAVTGLIAGILPKNTTLPSIAGVLKSGNLLSATPGTWTGSEPIAYKYQWQLCVLGTCTNIAKATSSTFALGPLDVGDALRVIVTASNVVGSVPATSGTTGTILGL